MRVRSAPSGDADVCLRHTACATCIIAAAGASRRSIPAGVVRDAQGRSLRLGNPPAKYCSQRCKLLATQPERARRYQLKAKYGITAAEFDTMLAAQGGGCAVCGTTEPPGRGQRFHVDHCHSTGRVRGLLCNECNVGLGKFKDSTDLLRRAAEYLMTQRENP